MTVATLLFGWMNYRGNSFAGKFQVVLTFLLTVGIISLFTGSASLETAQIGNLFPLFAEHRSELSCVLIIFAISPFLFVGFDTVPQAAEEFTFEPARARNIMIVAILCGVVLYSLVTLAVGVAIPYPDMLAKMDAMRATGGTAWATGEVASMAFGKLGAIVLACAVMGAVCTGINGFYIATSRLLLSMARGRILPAWFGDIHPKYRTPYKAILFTIAIVLLTPFAGRSVVVWIVDMSSVGTGIGYLFSCLAARRVLLGSNDVSDRSVRMFCCGMGILASVMSIVLLLIPGSPAYISEASRWCMVTWIGMGVFFYYSNRNEWAKLPEDQLRKNILGSADIPVFFKSKAPQGQPQTVSE